MIREQHFGTPSSTSGDSLFVDAFSSPITECHEQTLEKTLLQNLLVTKLEQFDILGESQNSQIKCNESLEDDDEMPIIKNNSVVKKTANGSDASDKGMFNVSRVKKVELSEIPLDISTAAAAAARKFILKQLILSHHHVKHTQRDY